MKYEKLALNDGTEINLSITNRGLVQYERETGWHLLPVINEFEKTKDYEAMLRAIHCACVSVNKDEKYKDFDEFIDMFEFDIVETANLFGRLCRIDSSK